MIAGPPEPKITCLNPGCNKPGSHYVPPSLGDEGFFICDQLDDEGNVKAKPTPRMDRNVLVYASDIEPGTIDQAAKSASLPFVHGHVALMPDAHVGFGSTVGSVIPTKGAIIPAAIGVDIGCGMIAVQTSLRAEHLPDSLGPLAGLIRDAVPAGMGKSHAQEPGTAGKAAYVEHKYVIDRHFPHDEFVKYLPEQQQRKAYDQFGSLGGGNHFVEVSLDENDAVWVILHSGSRGIGNQLAEQHIESAKGLMQRYFIDLPDPDLAYLVEGTAEFDAYIQAMLWAQDYAMGNREAMMDAVLDVLGNAVYGPNNPTCVDEVQRINCHHNYTEKFTPVPSSDSQHSDNRLLVPRRDASPSTTQGSPGDYRPDVRSYDELVQWAEDIAQGQTPSPDGAPARSLISGLADDLVQARGRIPIAARSDHHGGSPKDRDVAADARTIVSTSSDLPSDVEETVRRKWDMRLARKSDHDDLGERSSRASDQHLPLHDRSVWLTRKGAIDASPGKLGIIPGSMGTSTYIVEGRGCAGSYNSCSHGAGRRLSRGHARRELSLDAFKQQMTDAGITWNDRDAVALLDEAPDSYKNIHQVMADSTELVTVKHTLRQVLNYKGVDTGNRRKRK